MRFISKSSFRKYIADSIVYAFFGLFAGLFCLVFAVLYHARIVGRGRK